MLLRDDPDARRWGAIGVDATGRVVEHPGRPLAAAARGRGDGADVHGRPRAGARAARSPAAGRLGRHPRRLHPGVAAPARRSRRSRTRGTSPSTRRPSATWRATSRCCAIPALLARSARPARRRRSGRGDRRGARGCSSPAASRRARSSRRAPRSARTWSLGAGARVAAGARVERAVVWPGAVVTGDVADAVVTPSGTVVVE